MPRLSILIATLERRHEKFGSLVKELSRQAQPYGDDIEILAYPNNGEVSIGQIRQALLEAASGDYICFIDDDDWVPAYYCAEIMKNLGRDYIGFEVEFIDNGKPRPRVFHSIVHKDWHQDALGYYRSVTHLNPILRSIAMQTRFDGPAGEDERWSLAVAPLVKNEHYIDKIMYIYQYNSETSYFAAEYLHDNPSSQQFDLPNLRYINQEPK
jgi:glycosyltransferase involved in cell wall biosynthesis